MAGRTKRSASGLTEVELLEDGERDSSCCQSCCFCLFCFPCFVFQQCTTHFESNTKKEALEWLDCLLDDLQEINGRVGQWNQVLFSKVRRLRKKSGSLNTAWFKDYAHNLQLAEAEKQALIKRGRTHSGASKLLSEGNIDIMSGQNFLLLKNRDFLM